MRIAVSDVDLSSQVWIVDLAKFSRVCEGACSQSEVLMGVCVPHPFLLVEDKLVFVGQLVLCSWVRGRDANLSLHRWVCSGLISVPHHVKLVEG